MYLILDDAVRKSLIERTKVIENFNTSLLEHEEAKEENNPTLDMLFQRSENTIYMYSRPGKTKINDILTFLTVNEGVPQNVKCKKLKLLVSLMRLKKSIMFLYVIRMMYIKSLLKKSEYYVKRTIYR